MKSQFQPRAIHKLKKASQNVVKERYAQQYNRMVPSDILGWFFILYLGFKVFGVKHCLTNVLTTNYIVEIIDVIITIINIQEWRDDIILFKNRIWTLNVFSKCHFLFSFKA